MSKRGADDALDGTPAEKKLKTDANEEACIDVNITDKNYKPRLRDAQNLLLRTFTTEYGENPKFICIRGMPHITTALVLLIPMLDASMVRQVSTKLPLLSGLLQCQGATASKCLGELESLPRDQKLLPVGSQMLQLLLTAIVVPSVQDPKKKKKAKNGKALEEEVPAQAVPATQLLASEAELTRSGYPLVEDAKLDPAWVTTADFLASKAGSGEQPTDGTDADLFAIDCEMVRTCSGLSLARISVVNSCGEAVYDTLVKPTEAVIDYVTEFSGITQQMLEGITTTLTDVQARLKTIFHKDSILIGHSLESDFKALQLAHERVIDTAILYPHAQGWPSRQSLKSLLQSFLHRSLDRAQGHDSVADAKAALDLVQLKMEKGIAFGAPSKQSHPLGQLLRKAGSRLVVEDFAQVPSASSSGHKPWHFTDAEEGDVTCRQLDTKPERTVRVHMARALEFYCQKQDSGQGDAALAAIEKSARDAISSLQSSDMLTLMTSGTSKAFPGEEQLSSIAGAEHRSQQRHEGFAVFLTAREAKAVASVVADEVREMITYDCS